MTMQKHRGASRRTLRQIFAAPLALAAVTAGGLVAALIGDGVWDALSWIMLGVPLAALAVFVSRAGRSRPSKQRRQ